MFRKQTKSQTITNNGLFGKRTRDENLHGKKGNPMCLTEDDVEKKKHQGKTVMPKYNVIKSITLNQVGSGLAKKGIYHQLYFNRF